MERELVLQNYLPLAVLHHLFNSYVFYLFDIFSFSLLFLNVKLSIFCSLVNVLFIVAFNERMKVIVGSKVEETKSHMKSFYLITKGFQMGVYENRFFFDLLRCRKVNFSFNEVGGKSWKFRRWNKVFDRELRVSEGKFVKRTSCDEKVLKFFRRCFEFPRIVYGSSYPCRYSKPLLLT